MSGDISGERNWRGRGASGTRIGGQGCCSPPCSVQDPPPPEPFSPSCGQRWSAPVSVSNVSAARSDREAGAPADEAPHCFQCPSAAPMLVFAVLVVLSTGAEPGYR